MHLQLEPIQLQSHWFDMVLKALYIAAAGESRNLFMHMCDRSIDVDMQQARHACQELSEKSTLPDAMII